MSVSQFQHGAKVRLTLVAVADSVLGLESSSILMIMGEVSVIKVLYIEIRC